MGETPSHFKSNKISKITEKFKKFLEPKEVRSK